MTVQPPGRIVIAPSLLAADFGRLREEVASVTQAGADWLHFDIMDGHFVPNISFGPQVLAALRPHSALPFDVHLMISPTDPFVAAFAEAGADHISIHPEAGPHPHRTLQLIRSLGKKAGVVLNPGAPIESIAWLLDLADIVLVMSVNPGFGGQRFLPSQLPKIAALRRMIDDAARLDADARPVALAVDGGITPDTAGEVLAAGADTLIAGTSVFAAPDRAAAIAALRGGARGAGLKLTSNPPGETPPGDIPLESLPLNKMQLADIPLNVIPSGEASADDARMGESSQDEATRGNRLRGGAG